MSSFELFRTTMGRRTREQALALDWTGDATELVDALFVFGPATTPIVEA